MSLPVNEKHLPLILHDSLENISTIYEKFYDEKQQRIAKLFISNDKI